MNPISPGLIPTELNKASLTLNPTSLPSSEGRLAILTEGQLIKASVQEVTHSVVWLKAAGQSFRANTQLPLQPGQQVLLKVIEVNPRRVTLQVQTASSQSAAPNLETWLSSWGLPPDETNLTIAQAMLKHAQSVIPEDIQTIRTLWRTLPALPQASAAIEAGQTAALEALTFLHLQKLPISQESLALAQRWLKGLPPLTEQLADLQRAFDDVLPQLPPTEVNQQNFDRLYDALISARGQIANWPITPERPIAEVIANLTTTLGQLGTPSEAKLAAVLRQASSLSTLPDRPSEGQQLNPLSVQTDGPDSSPLPRLAQVIAEVLAQGELEPPLSQALHRLADRLAYLSSDLSATHLANLTNYLAGESSYFFPIPLTTPAGQQTAHLKVYQQPGRRQVDPDNLRLALLLNVPALGEIAINLTIFERHLSGQILSGQKLTHQRVEAEISQLRSNLSHLGYQVEALTCDLLAKPKLNLHPSPFNGIDVSA